MRLEIGNKVAVLDNVLKGVVTKIEGQTVFFEDEEGMVYNFNASDLVKVDENQEDLLKYSKINNRFLNQKKASETKKKSAFKTVKKEVVLEVDLHAEKLLKSTKGLDNFDILNIQIDTAKRKLEFAIQKKISKIIFIHGVGQGVLKNELHYLLNRYPVKYSDGSYKHYGLGATEVYVYQNP